MSFRVETAPNRYTDYQILSAARWTRFGEHLLSLANPHHQATNASETASTRPVLHQPSDLCRPAHDQSPYYFVKPDVMKQIEENYLPHRSILPYTPSTAVDESLPSVTRKSSHALLSQIVTVVQCQPSFSSSSAAFESPRPGRPAVRLFISSDQQPSLEAFLDTVNEALLLEPDTIRSVWDAQGEKILDPVDLLRRGRLYFASRTETLAPDQLTISDAQLASINRFESVREHFSPPAHLVAKPAILRNIRTPSLKSSSFLASDRRSLAAHGQPVDYNDPQIFPDVFLRHYTVGEILGDGRFSTVFQCVDKATGIQLALKMIDRSRCQGHENLIENELAILRRVKHPNIIKLVEEFQNDARYFLVLEYVPNGDLLTALSKTGKYSEHDVALMLSQIAAALKYLHSLQIVHRDVKLENILLAQHADQSVTLKLADFGLALCLTDRTDVGESLCGTPMYLAPELIQSRDYRIENDLWSLGIIAFTLLSGMAPFDGDNDEEIIANVLQKNIDFALLPQVSEDCRKVLLAMLERDPAKRLTANDLLRHPWMKHNTQKRMGPSGDVSPTRRRKKVIVQQQPLLSFASVEPHHPAPTSSRPALINDLDEL